MPTDPASLLLLLNWMSPVFPIGAFAYSHGLEQAIADSRLHDAESVEGWIRYLLHHGSGWNDAVLFTHCWKDDAESVNEFALALCSSRERYVETTQLGRAFAIAAAVWTGDTARDHVVAYPFAAGRACKDFGIFREQALIAFLQGYCSALVSVAVRLVPLGQTQGLEVLRNLSSDIGAVATRALDAKLEDIGGHCIAADISAMQHEVLQPRMFRT